ncbi:PREDICTED: putative receptor-like protein kinase At3g47110 [Ipomoea nil]|uniref:putative receptor-like protein kinase At3g47110 n=1 Tax=Ipomoea nil TaxID=35883 RepID=UPI000901AB6B|nr:PREDICTED: putative receptor-like protein kinase At3g47110 [Ipomoea nil]
MIHLVLWPRGMKPSISVNGVVFLCGRRHMRVMVVNLTSLKLVGLVPSHIGNMSFLKDLDLQNNSFSGPIPPELGSCIYLEILNLTNNNFEGPIPSTLANLRGMQFLELSHNHLIGQIPSFLKDFKLLMNLNVSYNEFEGAVPTTGIFNNTRSVSIAANKKLCRGIPELKLPECNSTKPKKRNSKAHLKVVIPLTLGIGLILVVFLLCLRWLRRQRKESFLICKKTSP